MPEFSTAIQQLASSTRDNPFAWGDLAVAWETANQDEFYQEITKYTEGYVGSDEVFHAPVINESTLKTRMWTAQAIPATRRVQGLTFTHHRMVAGQTPEIQDKLLATASRLQLKSGGLRKLMVEAGLVDPPKKKQRVCGSCGSTDVREVEA